MSLAITASVLVIDHNPILLEGIACLIRTEPDLLLVGTATNMKDGLVLATSTEPDCILIDLDRHSAAGFEVLKRLRQSSPRTKIIGLVTYELDDRVPAALAFGASAVLGKDQLSQSLVNLIRKVSRPA
jgi:DNA-binding NarL/FixJ family response regulator